jgi:hypothetical protein
LPGLDSYVGIYAATLQQSPSQATTEPTLPAAAQGFVDRLYDLVRNDGLTPAERAMNFALAQLYQMDLVPGGPRQLTTALNSGLSPLSIHAEPSPMCRPGSQCWDVKLTFFTPQQTTWSPKTTYRLSVEVGDVKPMLLGPPRSWTWY